ncbi:Cutinase [Dactylellina cionopaga]|nr:Cutinase [Dactylellina cionopaga]
MAIAQTSTCPPIPSNNVSIGQPVPTNPADIPAGCSALEILVARGTSEPGKFGIIVGDNLVGNVTAILPGARGYPVQYPASIDVISGGLQGRVDIVNRLISQSLRCPSQKFALVGYSQGASLMHQAVGEVPISLYPKILALCMFGDPNLRLGALGDRFPLALRSKVLQSCAKGDLVCDTGSCEYWHLSYIRPEWINRATNFIVNAYRGTPLPPSTTVGI